MSTHNDWDKFFKLQGLSNLTFDEETELITDHFTGITEDPDNIFEDLEWEDVYESTMDNDIQLPGLEINFTPISRYNFKAYDFYIGGVGHYYKDERRRSSVIPLDNETRQQYDKELALKYGLFTPEQILNPEQSAFAVFDPFLNQGQYFSYDDPSNSLGTYQLHRSTIRESIAKSVRQQIFEPNGVEMWNEIRTMISSYLWLTHQAGTHLSIDSQYPDVLVGLGQTMTTQDIMEGRVIVEYELDYLDPLKDGLTTDKIYTEWNRITMDLDDYLIVSEFDGY